MKNFIGAVLAAILVAGLAFGANRPRFSGSTFSSSDAQSATGWTYNGTQSISITDAAIPTNSFLYLNGATRSIGFSYNGSAIVVSLPGVMRPATDQQWSLGTGAFRVSQTFTYDLMMGTSGAKTFTSDNPTVAACTGAARTHGNTVSFQMDVGTSCAGVSAITLTLSAATNGWSCRGRHITSGATRYLGQTGAVSTTSVTMTNFVRTTGVAGDFADGDDVSIECMSR